MRRSAVLALVLFGCGGSDSPSNLLPGFNPPPPPANGVQYIMPIVHNLAPGSDNEMCTWIGDKLDHDIDIKTIQGYQTAGGHHIILYATTQPQPAGTTRPCLGTDTVTFRFAAGSGGEGTGAINTAPGNLV